jgi:hypothetical protein
MGQAKPDQVQDVLGADGPSFAGLSPRQVDALGNVAFGGYGAGCNRRTLESLEKRGLIVRHHVVEGGPLGALHYDEWEMPVAVHIAFCQWCEAASYLATSPAAD